MGIFLLAVLIGVALHVVRKKGMKKQNITGKPNIHMVVFDLIKDGWANSTYINI